MTHPLVKAIEGTLIEINQVLGENDKLDDQCTYLQAWKDAVPVNAIAKEYAENFYANPEIEAWFMFLDTLKGSEDMPKPINYKAESFNLRLEMLAQANTIRAKNGEINKLNTQIKVLMETIGKTDTEVSALRIENAKLRAWSNGLTFDERTVQGAPPVSIEQKKFEHYSAMAIHGMSEMIAEQGTEIQRLRVENEKLQAWKDAVPIAAIAEVVNTTNFHNMAVDYWLEWNT